MKMLGQLSKMEDFELKPRAGNALCPVVWACDTAQVDQKCYIDDWQ